MLERQEFYWGAALVRLVDDSRCNSLVKKDAGYLVNSNEFVAFKYSTKSRTPWRFSFGEDEFDRLESAANCHRSVVIAFICGGDGVCAIAWPEIISILGDKGLWISVKRNFHKQYGVAGPNGSLERKVSVQEWPNLLFASQVE